MARALGDMRGMRVIHDRVDEETKQYLEYFVAQCRGFTKYVPAMGEMEEVHRRNPTMRWYCPGVCTMFREGEFEKGEVLCSLLA